MSEPKEVKTERVDDIPLLLAQMQKLGIAEVLDKQINRHGLRRGLSVGEIVTVWLCYIVSQGDHRKSYLEGWAAERLRTLSGCLSAEVSAGEFNDDRLGDVLCELSDDETWRLCEQALNKRSVRVYRLRPKVVRCDSTTVSSYGRVDEDGLLQFGHSKDRRPDLPQVKVATSTLDPLGMPLVTLAVSGEQADDPLYHPLIDEVRMSFGQGGLLFVGDSKMGALATRAQLAAGGDYYLCPLSKVQVSDKKLSDYLQRQEAEALMQVKRRSAKGEMEVIAEGFELSEVCRHKAKQWRERRLLVRSLVQADKQAKRLESQLQQAETELAALVTPKRGRRRPDSRAELEVRVAEVLKRHGVKSLLKVTISEQQEEKRLRAYGRRAARTQRQLRFQLQCQVDALALVATKARLGWRVLASNQPAEQLAFAKAVLVHRDAYLHERGYSRLKGQPLSLTPLYLQRDEQIKGLIRLLSIALRVLTLLEFVLRRKLAGQAQQLTGLYAGNPKRKTARPSAELLLYAFRNITLTVIRFTGQVICHLTELSTLQQAILQLLDLDKTIYTSLTVHSRKLTTI